MEHTNWCVFWATFHMVRWLVGMCGAIVFGFLLMVAAEKGWEQAWKDEFLRCLLSFAVSAIYPTGMAKCRCKDKNHDARTLPSATAPIIR